MAISSKNVHFWEKDLLREDFQNSVPKRFIATRIHVLCAIFVKYVVWEVDKVARCLPHREKKNKNSAHSLAVASAWIAPKICQGQ